jgi:DNA-binding NtrC family response regulator
MLTDEVRGGTRRGDTDSVTMRRRPARTDVAPCLFLVARGHQPTSPPLRLSLHRHAQVEVRRGEALDVAPQRGQPALELAIPDSKVSARHARFERCLGAWCVKDDQSKNGTFVNGERVEQAILGDGDLVDFGDTLFVFRDGMPHGGEIAYQPPPSLRRGMSSLLPAVQAELDELARMAASPITILIEGETGTGKEVIARAIHALSARTGEMIPVNCGGLPTERVEAELFGWKRGAFSGATADHPGLVCAADAGTLFLDEIGDLRLADQASLLRVLQEREVLPIGGMRPVAVDLRVVAATHRPLDAMADSAAFRSDLLARLTGYRIRIPPLRQRREDLGLFLADMLGQRRGADGCRLTIGVLRALLRHDWPTNVRGLEQTLTRALVTSAQGVIDVDDVVRTLGDSSGPPSASPLPSVAAPPAMSGPSGARGDTPEARSARNSEARDARKTMSGPSGARGDTPEARSARNSKARDARKKVSRAVALVIAIAAGTGCLPSLVAESSPPPGRAARLDVDTGFWGWKHYRLELSHGVAVAIGCEHGGPCAGLVATSDNPAVAEVRAASLTALRPAGFEGNRQPAATLVIVGKAPGSTTIRVRTKDGGRDLPVTVVAAPGSPVATTAAR